MENDSKEKLVLATLSKTISERDKTIYKIQSLLDSEFDEKRDDVNILLKHFDVLSQQELTIETIQVFYARHFQINKQE